VGNTTCIVNTIRVDLQWLSWHTLLRQDSPGVRRRSQFSQANRGALELLLGGLVQRAGIAGWKVAMTIKGLTFGGGEDVGGDLRADLPGGLGPDPHGVAGVRVQARQHESLLRCPVVVHVAWYQNNHVVTYSPSTGI